MMERWWLPEQQQRLMSVISIAFLFMRDDLKYCLGMRWWDERCKMQCRGADCIVSCCFVAQNMAWLLEDSSFNVFRQQQREDLLYRSAICFKDTASFAPLVVSVIHMVNVSAESPHDSVRARRVKQHN
jgi:hypothetical protein